MKTNKFIWGIIVAFFATSCNFLESESPSAMDVEAVFKSPVLTGQAIAGVYDVFGGDRGYRNRLACSYAGLNTDIERGYKGQGRGEYNIYTITPVCSDLTNAEGKDAWGHFNVGIERCNKIIEGIEGYADLNDKQMSYYLGEAYFLRSFLYLEMVKLWGDVPARFESLEKNPEGAKTPKTNRNVIYEQLRVDLKKAAQYLPWSNACPGTALNKTDRPSKASALALLMRNDMFYAGKSIRPDSYMNGPVENVDANKCKELYEEVLSSFSEIMNGPGEDAKLLQDKDGISGFERVFRNVCADVNDYYNSEMIWEIPFNINSRGQVLQYNCPKSQDALKGLKNNTSGSTNSAVMIVPTLYYDFAEGDVRRDVTMAPFQWIYDTGTKFNKDADKVQAAFPSVNVAGKEKFLYQKMQNIAEFYAAKYRVEWMSRERQGNDDGVNFPIIRYADVLLMAAEATLGGITGAVPDNLHGVDGQKCFDRVRQRAGVATRELTMANIQEERKFEFAGEYIRKYDLMRWGILKPTLEAAHTRIENMNLHQDEFAGMNDTIYFKYKAANEYAYADGIKGFVIDSVYGLKKGQKGKPATYSAENGWTSKCIYAEEDGRFLSSSSYMLFDREHPENLNSRQLWPIFNVNLGSENLWNDYGYPN